MKKFLSLHPTVIIGSLTLIFVAVFVAFYVWGINEVIVDLRVALVPPVSQSVTGFDLAAAAKLNLPGSTTTPATAPSSNGQ